MPLLPADDRWTVLMSPPFFRFSCSALPAPGGSASERPHPDRGLPDEAEAPQAAIGPRAALLLQSLPSARPHSQPRLFSNQTVGLLSSYVWLASEVPSAHHHWFSHQGASSYSDVCRWLLTNQIIFLKMSHFELLLFRLFQLHSRFPKLKLPVIWWPWPTPRFPSRPRLALESSAPTTAAHTSLDRWLHLRPAGSSAGRVLSGTGGPEQLFSSVQQSNGER